MEHGLIWGDALDAVLAEMDSAEAEAFGRAVKRAFVLSGALFKAAPQESALVAALLIASLPDNPARLDLLRYAELVAASTLTKLYGDGLLRVSPLPDDPGGLGYSN